MIAEYIKDLTGGDIFEIIPVKRYPSVYKEVTDQALKEIRANYKPQLQTEVKNMDTYDLIFIGSPNWWSTIAPPVSAFLSDYDFKGKMIVPFITHEGSGMGHSKSDIKQLCSTASIQHDHAFRGRRVQDAHDEVSDWLKEIK